MTILAMPYMTNTQKKVNKHLIDISQCPECRHGRLGVQKDGKHIICLDCNKYFPIVDGRPVLLRYDNTLFRVDEYTSAERVLSISLHSLNLSPSVNLARNRILPQLRSKLDSELSSCTILVVGGGKQRLALDHLIGGQCSNLRIFYSDIDTGADVDLFCDGHDLPFNRLLKYSGRQGALPSH